LPSQKTYVSSAFPVHYSGLAIPTVPYTHEDSASLRILAKLLTSKFLLPEVREKGGAYGAGASASPSSGTFTFYSYRDPNLHSTVETFEKCTEWVTKKDSFTDRDIIEAKLGVFQAIDRPVLPGNSHKNKASKTFLILKSH
jgi:Zn-dependent M16 (insulinase) family peptidase